MPLFIVLRVVSVRTPIVSSLGNELNMVINRTSSLESLPVLAVLPGMLCPELSDVSISFHASFTHIVVVCAASIHFDSF